MKASNSEQESSYTSRIGTTVLEAVGVDESQAYEEDSEWTEASEEDAESTTQTDSQRTEPASDASDSDEPVELPLDQVFEILKNSRRREVLHYLEEEGNTATLSDLAEHIAALENDTSVKAISSSQRKRVYVGLYQCHLPKMDDMGIVSFDKNRGTIELEARAAQLEPYLEPAEETVAWPRVYLGIALVGGAVFGLATLGVLPALITPGFVSIGLLTLVAGTAIGHWYVEAESDT